MVADGDAAGNIARPREAGRRRD